MGKKNQKLVLLDKWVHIYLNFMKIINLGQKIMFRGVWGVRKVTKTVSAGCRTTLFFAPFLLIYAHMWAHILIFRWYTSPSTWSMMILAKKITQKCQMGHLWWIFEKMVQKYSMAHISELFFVNFRFTPNPSQATVFEPQAWNFTGMFQTGVATKLPLEILIFGPKKILGPFF